MPKILFVNACPRENSRTLSLARCALSFLQGEVEVCNLYDMPLQPLDAEGLSVRGAAFASKDFSAACFAPARQFVSADIIVIAAPYWDMMFPSVLKTYLESVTVNGLAFAYNTRGIPEGRCAAKRLIYVTTAGGPIINNFGFDYVASVSRTFFGISDVRFLCAERLDLQGADPIAILEKAKQAIPAILSEER